MLISNMQTYLSDKMHPKRVMSQKRSPKNVFSACFGQKKVDFGFKQEFLFIHNVS
jgi:hypothetical protein